MKCPPKNLPSHVIQSDAEQQELVFPILAYEEYPIVLILLVVVR